MYTKLKNTMLLVLQKKSLCKGENILILYQIYDKGKGENLWTLLSRDTHKNILTKKTGSTKRSVINDISERGYAIKFTTKSLLLYSHRNRGNMYKINSNLSAKYCEPIFTIISTCIFFFLHSPLLN